MISSSKNFLLNFNLCCPQKCTNISEYFELAYPWVSRTKLQVLLCLSVTSHVHLYTPELRLDARPVVCSEIVAGLVTTDKSFLLYKTENEVLSCWDMLRVLLTFMCFIFTSCFCTTFTLPKLIRLHNLNTEMLSFRSWFTAC